MIPKIFHHVWIGPLAETQTWPYEWCNIMPEYQLMVWNNDTAMPYIKRAIEQFGFDSLFDKPMTYISDIIRLYIIHDHGGIYMDHDIQLLKDLTPLLTEEVVLTFQYSSDMVQPDLFGAGETLCDLVDLMYAENSIVEYHSDNVNNCFIASVPNHPLIQYALEDTYRNHIASPECQYPMSDWGVGPSVFTTSARAFGLDVSVPCTIIHNGIKIMDHKYVHPLHGWYRNKWGVNEYNRKHRDIVDNKTSYAVHYHEHVGAQDFIERKAVLFGEWVQDIL